MTPDLALWQGKDLTGTLANRPPANSVPVGTHYLATDDNGGTDYRSDGANWVKSGAGALETGGQELDYAESGSYGQSTTVYPTRTTFADLTIAPNAKGKPMLVRVRGVNGSHSVSGKVVVVSIMEGAAEIGLGSVGSPSAAGPAALSAEARLAASTGARTFNTAISVTTAGTGTLSPTSSIRAVSG